MCTLSRMWYWHRTGLCGHYTLLIGARWHSGSCAERPPRQNSEYWPKVYTTDLTPRARCMTSYRCFLTTKKMLSKTSVKRRGRNSFDVKRREATADEMHQGPPQPLPATERPRARVAPVEHVQAREAWPLAAQIRAAALPCTCCTLERFCAEAL